MRFQFAHDCARGRYGVHSDAHTEGEIRPEETHMIAQRVEGTGDTPEHAHAAVTHAHDHYHVTHHHKSGLTGEGFDHRSQWHTHDHNHNELIHSHDFSTEEEVDEHAKEAHIHDHAAPATSPA
jgi:hypothetical protein